MFPNHQKPFLMFYYMIQKTFIQYSIYLLKTQKTNEVINERLIDNDFYVKIY